MKKTPIFSEGKLTKTFRSYLNENNIASHDELVSKVNDYDQKFMHDKNYLQGKKAWMNEMNHLLNDVVVWPEMSNSSIYDLEDTQLSSLLDLAHSLEPAELVESDAERVADEFFTEVMDVFMSNDNLYTDSEDKDAIELDVFNYVKTHYGIEEANKWKACGATSDAADELYDYQNETGEDEDDIEESSRNFVKESKELNNIKSLLTRIMKR